METRISQQQRDAIKLSIQAGTFVMEDQLQKLADIGIERNAAAAIIADVAKDYKAELFQKTLKKQKGEGAREAVFLVVFMLNLVGPLFQIDSLGWYLIVFIASGVGGYIGFRSKPAAGIIAALVFSGIFPFAYSWYFTGRTSFIRIEMLIPMAVAVIPAAAILWILSSILPGDDD